MRKRKKIDIQKTEIVKADELQGLFMEEDIRKAIRIEELRKEIFNDKMVVDCWNLLVKHKKMDKRDLYDGMALGAGALGAGAALFGTMAVGKGADVEAVRNAFTFALAGGALALDADLLRISLKDSKLDAIEEKLFEMQVKEPKLYDVIALYNGYLREDLDTTDYDGRAEFEELHKMWLELEKKRAKAQEEQAL